MAQYRGRLGKPLTLGSGAVASHGSGMRASCRLGARISTCIHQLRTTPCRASLFAIASSPCCDKPSALLFTNHSFSELGRSPRRTSICKSADRRADRSTLRRTPSRTARGAEPHCRSRLCSSIRLSHKSHHFPAPRSPLLLDQRCQVLELNNANNGPPATTELRLCLPAPRLYGPGAPLDPAARGVSALRRRPGRHTVRPPECQDRLLYRRRPFALRRSARSSRVRH
jgi:hypothetical protein